VLTRAAEDGQSLTFVDIDPQNALDKRFSPGNDLFSDRQPGQYTL
jgi:hypothetical protein